MASRSAQKRRDLFLALVKKVGPLPTSALASADPPRQLVRSTQDTSVQLATRVPKNLHRALRLYCVRAGVSLMEFAAQALEEKLARKARQNRRRARAD